MTWLIHRDWKRFPSFTAKQESCQHFIAASFFSAKLSLSSSLNVSGGCLKFQKRKKKKKRDTSALPSLLLSHPSPHTSWQYRRWWSVGAEGQCLQTSGSRQNSWIGQDMEYDMGTKSGSGGPKSWKYQVMRANWDSFNLGCFLCVCDLRWFKSPITHQRGGVLAWASPVIKQSLREITRFLFIREQKGSGWGWNEELD